MSHYSPEQTPAHLWEVYVIDSRTTRLRDYNEHYGWFATEAHAVEVAGRINRDAGQYRRANWRRTTAPMRGTCVAFGGAGRA